LKADANQLNGSTTTNFVKTSLKNIREFLKETNEEIDYKEKNLENVTDVITIMNALGHIERYQVDHMFTLDTIEEMLEKFN